MEGRRRVGDLSRRMTVPRLRIVGVLLVAIAIAMSFVACGGGSSSDGDEGEPSKSFLTKNGKNTIPTFGEEADAEEREAASEVLEENMKARAAGDWAKQCASLTVGAVKKLKGENEERGGALGTCVKDLEFQGEPKSASAVVRVNTLTGPIDALRVKGTRGWALYHGTGGSDYAMPMEKVGEEWKVGSLTTTELP